MRIACVARVLRDTRATFVANYFGGKARAGGPHSQSIPLKQDAYIVRIMQTHRVVGDVYSFASFGGKFQ